MCCLILDANFASAAAADSRGEDYAPVWRWLRDKERDGRMVLGGKLTEELNRIERVRRFVLQLLRAGRAHRLPNDLIDSEQASVEALGLCRSDDPHVIALARVSGARTLCSEDRDLHDDFKDPRLVSKPRGKIYRYARHESLLTHTGSCGALRRKAKKRR